MIELFLFFFIRNKLSLSTKSINFAMMMHNFNAGPGILPPSVLEAAAVAVHDFNYSGLSLLEIGHRTSAFVDVMEEARSLVRTLLQLDQDHEVLFLQGGATTQFMQIPMNLLDSDQIASYTETGTWSVKAIKEARLFGQVEIAGSTREVNYTAMPELMNVSSSSVYLHLTSNETIAGTQWHRFPENSSLPLIADMSSDIFSRQFDFNRFDLIYAGAQKNMGAAGVTLVVVNKNLLGKIKRTIPSIMDYRNHIAEGSMLNTPPVFAVYVAMLVLRWIKQEGGVTEMEQRNRKKSALLYSTLSSHTLYQLPVKEKDRSLMNVVFTLKHSELEAELMQVFKGNGLYGLEGHRSVGGFRASLYNALPFSSVEVLCEILSDFAQRRS
jgi:phosphoserine aminotransferase